MKNLMFVQFFYFMSLQKLVFFSFLSCFAYSVLASEMNDFQPKPSQFLLRNGTYNHSNCTSFLNPFIVSQIQLIEVSLYNAFEINQTTCKPSKVVLLTVLSNVLLDEEYCVCSMSIHRISDIFSVIDLYSKSYTFIVLLNDIKTPVWTSCICKVRKGCC